MRNLCAIQQQSVQTFTQVQGLDNGLFRSSKGDANLLEEVILQLESDRRKTSPTIGPTSTCNQPTASTQFAKAPCLQAPYGLDGAVSGHRR